MLYLTPKEFYSFSLTCRDFYLMAKDNEDIIVKQFHAILMSNQDLFISSIYENSSYTMRLKSLITQCMTATDSAAVKTYAESKLSLNSFLVNNFGSVKAQSFVSNLNSALIKPKLPALKLRRDCQSCETFSMYQTYLNDVYHGLDEESKEFEDAMVEEDEIFELSEEQTAVLMKIDPKSKDLVLYARWYLQNELKSTDNSQDADAKEEEEEEKKTTRNTAIINSLSRKICKLQLSRQENTLSAPKLNSKKAFYKKVLSRNAGTRKERRAQIEAKSPLIELYMRLYEVFSSYCNIIHGYLSKIENPLIFLVEYTSKWKNFVAAMQKIGGYLRQFSALVNKVYETEVSRLSKPSRIQSLAHDG